MNEQDIDEMLEKEGYYVEYDGCSNWGSHYKVYSIEKNDLGNFTNIYFNIIHVKGKQNFNNIYREILKGENEEDYDDDKED